ncbi:hypothetical protein [Rhizobium sp.]|uniref:hypothetical protein n=1 Tax=Rhizobium sp. TaxID=391 RepID=UPI0028A93A3F
MFLDPSRGASVVPAFLTLAEAAKLAGRSYSWAWNRAGDGRFEVRKFTQNGKIHVTASSVLDAMTSEQSVARRPEHRRRASHLRLIIDNTGK